MSKLKMKARIYILSGLRVNLGGLCVKRQFNAESAK